METVPKVKLCKLKITFPCTSYVKPAELMNASCLFQWKWSSLHENQVQINLLHCSKLCIPNVHKMRDSCTGKLRKSEYFPAALLLGLQFWITWFHTIFALSKDQIVRKATSSGQSDIPVSVFLELTWSEARPKWCRPFPYWSSQCALIVTEGVWSTSSTREWWPPRVTPHGNTACTALSYL